MKNLVLRILVALCFVLAILLDQTSFAIDYEYSTVKSDPFVPQYSSSKVETISTPTDRPPLSERYSLVGIWKSGDSKWRAMLSRVSAGADASDPESESEPLMLEVGSRIEAGVKLASIELGAVVLSESIQLPDGKIYKKLTRLGFENDD
jgi:hypothetical protein